MKVIVADVYALIIHNSKNTQFPKKFRNHKIIWNLREVLLELWKDTITELVIPELGTPGYDFPNFVQDMMEIGQIKIRPKFVYYKLNIIKKS